MSIGVIPGTPWYWAMVRLQSHWRKGSRHGVRPDVPACDARRVHALSGVRKGDSRSKSTSERGAMVARVVVNLSMLGVAPSRRVPGSAVER